MSSEKTTSRSDLRALGSGRFFAGIALMVEHLTCNQRVVGSSPTSGSKEKILWGGAVVAHQALTGVKV